MIGKMKLLSPLVVIAMLLSLVAGAIAVLPEPVQAADPPVLTVDVTAPDPDTTMSVCQYFYVNATVHNLGPGTAYNIEVLAHVWDTGSHIISTNPMVYDEVPSGRDIKVAFNVHCDEAAASTICLDVTWEDAAGASYGPAEDTVTVLQQEPAQLQVDILEPVSSTPVGVCQNFPVTARVSNPAQEWPLGANAVDVVATIHIDGNASLVPPPPEAQDIGTIGGQQQVDVTWMLHCDAPGDVTITVLATGRDPNLDAELMAGDEVSIHQVKAHLVTEIMSPWHDQVFDVCQDILVEAAIVNLGNGVATDVRATLDWDGPASLMAGDNPQGLRDLQPEDFDIATWTLHCDDPGDVTITVMADGTDALTGRDLRTEFDPPNVEDDMITIHQVKGHLVAEITAPMDGASFNVCQDIVVTATITNTGEGAAADVRATLEWDGPASLMDGANPQGLMDLGPGGEAIASWTLHCEDPGDVIITVKADGTSGRDLRTGFDPPNVEDDTITIHQVKGHLVAEIIAPMDGASFGVCQDIVVTATITNTGEGSATDVRATLEWDGPASLMDGANPQGLMNLEPGHYDTATWTMHCMGLGDVIITVKADGTSGRDLRTGFDPPNVEDDTITVEQRYLIELWGPEWDPEINPDGWNQISLMVRPENPDIAAVLDGIKDKVVSVWYYDASTEDWGGTWLSATYNAVTDTWVGDLTAMEDGKGYWVQVTENCTLALTGTPAAPMEPGPNVPPSYRVYKGWNLVGFSATQPMSLDEYFFSLYYNDILKKVWWWGSGPWYQWWLLDDIAYMEGFDGVVWMPSTAVQPSEVMLRPGQGYWIWVADDSEIVVPWNEHTMDMDA